MSVNVSRVTRYGYNASALVIAVLMIFPVLWVLLSSFKPASDLFSYPIKLIPESFTLENYFNVLSDGDFVGYFRNSIFVAVTSTAITVAINAMAGYAFAKFKFKGRDIIFVAFLCTTMVPQILILNPTFDVISKVGLYDSLWGIIIPPAATPTGLFIMRQFFLSVPDSLLESARIDGASEWRIFTRIMLPLAKAPLAILCVFSMMWRWNDFVWPLIVISDPSKYTIQLALANFAGEFRIDWSALLSASVITMVPLLIVFLFFQKYITNGMVTSGMKE